MPTLSAVQLGAIVLFGFVIYRISRIGKRESYLPPGPPTVPLLGNAHIFPTNLPYHQLTRWAREYGEIYSLKLGSGTVIVMSSIQAINAVFEKNQAVTADRPPMHFVDVVTNDLNMTMSRYGPKWRTLRRGAHEILTQKTAFGHRPIQDAECTQLMYEVLTKPETFFDSVRRVSISIILSVTFGKRVPRITSKELKIFFEAQHWWEYLLMPGTFAPVDFIPALKYLPDVLAQWRPLCERVKGLQRGLYFGLVGEVEQRIADGEPNGCYMETVCGRAKEWGMDREMIGYLGGALIEAGSDTTSSYTNSLILALVNYPEVQRKAQEELDRVVGTNRRATFEDLDQLPYIRAIVNEVHRFRPNTPLIPHAATADVQYGKYVIPAGSTIFANQWGMFQDPEVYEDPERFWPDRYMKSEFGTKPQFKDDPGRRNLLGFGYGRRVCPGIHVATYTTHMNTLNLLWGFNFLPPKDAEGKEYLPDTFNYAQALASSPNMFDCIIKPRSERHAEIIRKDFALCTESFEPFEHTIAEDDKKYLADYRRQL